MEYTFYKLSIAGKSYIGSTNDFNGRIRKHKYDCNNSNCKVYQYMRQNGGFEKVNIIIIDKIIYNYKEQAREMETNFMLSFNAELNSCYPKRSKKEYIEQHKEKNVEYHKQYDKEYIKKNKQIIAEKRKVKIACDICSKIMSKSNLLRHKKNIHSKPIDGNIHPF